MPGVLTRSSIFRGTIASGIDAYEVELYIYTGTQNTDRPATANYTLYVETVYDPVNDPLVKFTVEMSEYVNDFIESTYDGTWANSTTDAVWFDYRLRSFTPPSTYSSWSAFTNYQYEALSGYNYFEESLTALPTAGYGAEIATNKAVLISTGTTLYVPTGETLTIPIFRPELNTSYDVVYTDGTNNDFASGSYTLGATITESTGIIAYFTEDGTNPYTRIEQTHPTNPNSIINYIERVTEYKHTPIKIVFKNKFGALQEMWFFGKTILSTNTKSEGFNRAITKSAVGVVDNSISGRVKYNKTGDERITLNSGFQVEANNELFRQLMLSEQVWMHYDGNVVPVNVLDNQIQYKTSINDKLINYTINFEFAFNKILK